MARDSLLLLTIVFIGCQQQSGTVPLNASTPGTGILPVVVDGVANDSQLQIRPGDVDNRAHLDFSIVKVYRNQRPADAIPWHVDSGDWTFFDCQTSAPESAKFRVGVIA